MKETAASLQQQQEPRSGHSFEEKSATSSSTGIEFCCSNRHAMTAVVGILASPAVCCSLCSTAGINILQGGLWCSSCLYGVCPSCCHRVTNLTQAEAGGSYANGRMLELENTVAMMEQVMQKMKQPDCAYQAALQECTKVCEIREKWFLPSSPPSATTRTTTTSPESATVIPATTTEQLLSLADVYQLLASIYTQQKLAPEALQQYQKAMQTYQAVLYDLRHNPNHQNTDIQQMMTSTRVKILEMVNEQHVQPAMVAKEYHDTTLALQQLHAAMDWTAFCLSEMDVAAADLHVALASIYAVTPVANANDNKEVEVDHNEYRNDNNYVAAQQHLGHALGIVTAVLGAHDPRTASIAQDLETCDALVLEQQQHQKAQQQPEMVINWFEQQQQQQQQRASRGGRAGDDGTGQHGGTEEDNNMSDDNVGDDNVGDDDDDEGDVTDSEGDDQNVQDDAWDLMGVSIHWLKTGFWQEIQAAGLDEKATVFDLVQPVIKHKGEAVICPVDGLVGGSYVHAAALTAMSELPEAQEATTAGPTAPSSTPHNTDVVGASTVLLSYCWQYTIADIINTLDDYCVTRQLDPRQTFVWMDCLCSNLHRAKIDDLNSSSHHQQQDLEPRASFSSVNSSRPGASPTPSKDGTSPLEAIQNHITGIGQVLAMLTPWHKPLYLTRMSNLVELVTAHEFGCPVTLVLPAVDMLDLTKTILTGDPTNGLDVLYEVVDHLNIGNARASSQREKLLYLAAIEQEYGTDLAVMNHQIKHVLRVWIREVILAQVHEICSSSSQRKPQLHAEHMIIKEGENEEEDLDEDPSQLQPLTKVVGEQPVVEDVPMDGVPLMVCNQVGVLFWHHGEFAASMELLEMALAMTQAMYGSFHEYTAAVYCTMATVLTDSGDTDGALQAHRTALSILEEPAIPSISPATHSRETSIADTCQQIGDLLLRVGDYDLAMEMHQKGLSIRKKIHGGEHAKLADCFNHMGAVLFRKGDYGEALVKYSKALKLQEAIPSEEVASNARLAIATTHNHIGTTLQLQGQLEEALESHRKALLIQEEESRHMTDQDSESDNRSKRRDILVECAMTHDRIGTVLLRLDDLDGALVECQKALDQYEAVLGLYHPTTATSYNNVGDILNEMDDVNEALRMHQQAKEIQESVQGKTHPATAETMLVIGTLLYEIGDYESALEELRSASEILEPQLGKEHPKAQKIAFTIDAILASKDL